MAGKYAPLQAFFAALPRSKITVTLSFKKLEKCVTELMAQVKESINKFRKVMPHDIIARYEKNTQNDFKLDFTTKPYDPNVVSLFYLQEHLIDRLIKNKYGGGLSDTNVALKNIWLCCTDETKGNNFILICRKYARTIAEPWFPCLIRLLRPIPTN